MGKQSAIRTVLIGPRGCLWFLKALQSLVRRRTTDKIELFLRSDWDSQDNCTTNQTYRTTYRHIAGRVGWPLGFKQVKQPNASKEPGATEGRAADEGEENLERSCPDFECCRLAEARSMLHQSFNVYILIRRIALSITPDSQITILYSLAPSKQIHLAFLIFSCLVMFLL